VAVRELHGRWPSRPNDVRIMLSAAVKSDSEEAGVVKGVLPVRP